MNLNKLYDFLEKNEFQDTESGLLHFPVFIYTYDPKEEYTFREEIKRLKERLYRPKAHVNTLVINVYEEFIDYLKSMTLEGETILQMNLEDDEKRPGSRERIILSKANSDGFVKYLIKKFDEHFTSKEDKKKKVYVFIHGVGAIFPYLRVSEFIPMMEKVVQAYAYRLIFFYPGEFTGKSFSLFGKLPPDNVYRANYLNHMIA